MGSFVIRIALSVLVFAAILIVAALVYLNRRLVKSEAYKKSLSTALSSTELQNALGGDLHDRGRDTTRVVPPARTRTGAH